MSADLLPLLVLAVFLLATGAFAGLMAGLLGVGGGILLVPCFYYGFAAIGYGPDGLMQVALATSLATIIVTSLRSLQAHARHDAVDWTILRRWTPFIAAGALAGVAAAAGLSSRALQMLFGGLGMTVALYLAFGSPDWRLGAGMPGRAARALVGPVIGFLSVLLGIGGGSLGVPLMTLHGVPIHRAVATAAGFGLAISVPSVLGFLALAVPAGAAPPLTVGAVNLPAFACVVAMTLVTAPVGAGLAHRTDPRRLRRIFALFLAVVAANMLREALV